MRASDVAVVLAIALAACKRDAAPGSCYRTPDNACVEYGRSEAAAGKRLCAGLTWSAGEKSCPVQNRLGTCAKRDEHTTELLYSGPPNNFTPASAKSACEHAGGVFTPP